MFTRHQPGPMPPDALRGRVSGSLDETWFHNSGAQTVNEWSRALASQGMAFRDFPTILDFGCGCGRTLRHLAREATPDQALVGLDPDKEAIGWLKANFPEILFHALDELPPARDVSDGIADLVLSHSVFTHLPEGVQFAWLYEIARMLKSGGLLVASFHGAKVVDEYARSLIALDMPDASAHFSTTFNANGFFHVVGKNSFEDALPSYYGAAFHNISYITQRWTEHFAIRAWFPTFALGHQDVLVLRRL